MRTEIDARGLRCPLPLLRLKQALANAQAGEEVVIFTTDEGAKRDIPAFVQLTNHRILERIASSSECCFIVQKGA